MAGYNLATAYVSIVPTTKGFKNELKKIIGSDTDGVGDEQGEKVGSAFGSSLLKAVAAFKIGQKIGEFISGSISEAANLEQSLGGIETMFGDSADKVTAYAENAYKTAGLSANDYMEEVTSFSARLLQGLGGDTEAAAEYANLAITDMSDNVNKFGSDVTSVQSAYQGFAKQNYTMLDNLKLGYGGTATEMARLINDSGVLGEAVTVTASTVNDVSFDKMIEAIHVVQDDLGITGTTAQEAADTVSGSFNSMQSAYKNLIGKLALGTATAETADALTETAAAFVSNVSEMFLNLTTSVPSALLSIHDGVKDEIGGWIIVLDGAVIAADALAIALTVSLGQKAVLAVASFAKSTIKDMKTFVTAVHAGELSAKSLQGALGVLAITAGVGTLIAEGIDKLSDNILVGCENCASLTDEQKKLYDSTMDLSSTVRTLSDDYADAMDVIDSETGTLEESAEKLFDMAKAGDLNATELEELSDIVTELSGNIPGLELEYDELTGTLNRSKETVDALTKSYEAQQKLETDTSYLEGLQSQLTEAVNLKNQTYTALEAAKEKRDELLAAYETNKYGWSLTEYQNAISAANDQVGDLANAYVTANEALNDVETEISETNDAIADDTKALEDAEKSLYNVTYTVEGDIYKVTEEARDSINELVSGYKESLQEATDSYYGSLDLFTSFSDQFSADSEITADSLSKSLDSNLSGVEDWTSGMAKLIERDISDELLATLQEMGPSSLYYVQALNSMTDPELKKYSDKWEETYNACADAAELFMTDAKEETKNGISEILGLADEMSDEAFDAFLILGNAMSEGIAEGLTSPVALMAVRESIKSTALTCVDSVKEILDINSPSKVMRDLAVFIPEGMALGILDGAESVKNAVRDISDVSEFSDAVFGDINDGFGLSDNVRLTPADVAFTSPAASVSESKNENESKNKTVVFNLNLDAQKIATVTAPYIDVMNGATFNFINRGMAAS